MSIGLKKQEGYVGIVAVAQNLVGRDLAWSWFLTNWDIIKIYYNVIVSDISMPGVSPAISVIIKVFKYQNSLYTLNLKK